MYNVTGLWSMLAFPNTHKRFMVTVNWIDKVCAEGRKGHSSIKYQEDVSNLRTNDLKV